MQVRGASGPPVCWNVQIVVVHAQIIRSVTQVTQSTLIMIVVAILKICGNHEYGIVYPIPHK
jgi:hypothetical protein